MKQLAPIILIISSLIILANSGNAPSQRTGAPGESSCATVGCHSNQSTTINGSMLLSGLPEVLDADITYNLTLSMIRTAGTPLKAGFQMAAFSEGSTIGIFSNPGVSSTVEDNGGKQYFEHENAANFESDTIRYTVDWLTPSDINTKDVTFYIAGLFANADGTNGDDKLILDSLLTSGIIRVDLDEDGFDSTVDCNDEDAAINPGATEIPNNTIDENCDGTVQIIDEDLDGFNSDEDCDDSDSLVNPNATEIPDNDIDENCDGIKEMTIDTMMSIDSTMIDMDMDGFNVLEDCNDLDSLINPNALEIPDNDVDENCDGIRDMTVDTMMVIDSTMIDMDMDGFNVLEDCNDLDSLINPNAMEIPDNDVDENCDGIREMTVDTMMVIDSTMIDMDMDGFNILEDCDDNNASINPGATDIPNNGIDENCNGVALEIDEDLDGFNSDVDCNDNDASINPNAEEIPDNDVDENCDDIIAMSVVDLDMDGFDSTVDCNDNDASINPDADEIPNNDIDENCDTELGVIDEDMDGFNSDVDCNDNNSSIFPGATEIFNNDVDEDCDGVAQSTISDNDMDGFDSTVDCNDNDASINPNAEEIPNNGIDENCDSVILIIDEDDDGFSSAVDCDDSDPNINPGADEIPNNDIDEDCDGMDLILSLDNDMDGFTSDVDCDDNDASINPNAEEIPNNDIDENCDSVLLVIDEDEDGFNSSVDCDDTNAAINPDAEEIPGNNIDENCDMIDPVTGESLQGVIKDINGNGLNNVTVTLSDGQQFVTDSLGNFEFSTISSFENLTVRFSKPGNIDNGISGVDIIRISNHILGLIPFDNNLQILSSDVNGDGRVSSTDLVVLQRAILGFITEFPNRDSWGFVPEELTLTEAPISSFEIEAYKIGDVNGDADPSL